MLVINRHLSIPLQEFDFSFSRSSGPGGQNVNKVNTKATLRWAVAGTASLPEGIKERFLAKYKRRITNEGELVMQSQRFRDQGRNVADCLNKLREMVLEVATAPRHRRPTKPSKASKERRLVSKREKSQKKQQRRKPFLDE